MPIVLALCLICLLLTPLGLACWAALSGNIAGALVLVVIQLIVLWIIA